MQSALPTSVAGRLGYLLILLLLPFSSVHAQTGSGLGSVTGRVHTAAGGIPIQFANVTLHRAADSVAVKTEFSDAQGDFRLEHSVGGTFLVSVTQIGFTRYWSPVFPLRAGGQNLATIALQASEATQLKEVTIVKQKPLYERLADRTIVNVEGSTLTSGNSSLDVLTRAPGVTVNGNDNLALRGRQGILVLIDGKRQPMTGIELANYLRALPAEQISTIELITNPPAKYDAQGLGIIAINLKKDQRQGTNGTFNAAYGRGQYGKFTTGLTLNHRHNKVNAFGSYAYADRENFQKLTFDRIFYDGGVLQSSSNQQNDGRSHAQSHTWRGGVDYIISKRSVVGVVVGGLDYRFPGFAINRTLLFDAQGRPLPTYRSTINRRPYNPSITSNLNFKHSFADTSGAPTLSVDLDYDRFNRYADQELTTFFSEPGRSAVILDGDQEGNLIIQSLKADYTRTLRQATRLEAGLKTTLIDSDNDLVFEDIIDGVRTPNLNFSNRFRYNENINAAYITLTRSLPKLTLSVGLRGEQTNVEGQQEIGNEGFDRNYFQLFPSASVQRKFSDKHELSLSLNRRINRPTYNQLNPFRSYVDATSYRTGNPNLRPETSYNVELTHTYKDKYSAALSYSITNLPIISVVQPAVEGGFYVVFRDINLRTLQSYTLNLTAPFELTKWWSVYNSASVYYNHFNGKVAQTSPPRTWITVNASSNSTFTFGQGWSADLSGTYLAPERYGYERLRARGQLAIGIQKQLWNNRVSVKLNATDILYTSPVRSTYAYTNFQDTFYNRLDSRVVTLSFNYRFGNDKLAPIRRRQSGAEDEKRRAQ